MTQRVGVMGGTFDPVHLGHLRLAEEVVEALGLDLVLFVPAAVPPHKQGKWILDFEDRWRMLKAATDSHPRFEVSDIEQQLAGKSYTVVTLKRLSEVYRNEVRLFFILGMDAFLELDTWWHFRELFNLARMVVLRRPGTNDAAMDAFLKQKVSSEYAFRHDQAAFIHPELLPVHRLSNTCLDISSTRIRQLVSEGKSIRYLVLPEVMQYIHANGLYRSEGGFERAVGRVRHDVEVHAE